MNRCSLHKRRLALALLAAWLPLSAGCKAPWSSDWKMTDMFRMDKGMPWDDDGPEKGVPVRLVATWTDTVLSQPGKTPQRGFGGRLVFYGKKSNEPILIDGRLVVYAFDESNREPTDNRPTRRYVFPPDQVALRMSESGIGPSYSVWLPWDEVGGPPTEISLIARFEPKGGALLVGEQTKHMLPSQVGQQQTMVAQHTPPKLPDGIPMRPAIQPPSYSGYSGGEANGKSHQAARAIYESPVAGNATTAASVMPGSVAMPQPPQRRMTTTSISLPENFRLRGGAPPTRDTNPSTNSQPHGAQVQGAIQAAPAATGATGAYATPTPTSPLPPATGVNPTGYTGPQAMQYVPSPAVMPLWQSATVPSLGSGANSAPPSAPAIPQQQTPAATEMTTTVSYLSPPDPARWGFHPQPSTGSQPLTRPVPATPAFR